MPDIISLNMTSTSSDHMGRLKLLLVRLKTERWIYFTPCYVLPDTRNRASSGQWFCLTSMWPKVSENGMYTNQHKCFLFQFASLPFNKASESLLLVYLISSWFFFKAKLFLPCKFTCSKLVKLCTTYICPTVIKLS